VDAAASGVKRDGRAGPQGFVSDQTARGRTVLLRTVKSCGPDASVVGVKSSEAGRPDRARMCHIRRRRRQESPILRGELEVSRKAIAQGMSDVLR
jgi:hypothetical protein